MAYPEFTSSSGLKVSTTVKAAGSMGASYVFKEYIIQNHAATILKIKFGAGASTSDYDVILKACTVAADGTGGSISVEDFPDSQVISCYSAATPSYTYSYR